MPGSAPESAAIDSQADLAALIARFAADWAALVPLEERAGLAVSGGPDSLALLLLAHAAVPGRFEVATVDHRLRAESADEAKMVAEVCGARGIVHHTLAIDVPRSGNLQANARAARYAAMASWLRGRGLFALATGHHADDQAETLLMRLGRGSGVRGLAGMRPSAALAGSPDLLLVRPLLGWRRSELAGLVAAAGIAPAQDPSNVDARYERVRVRSVLAALEGLDAAALAASAAHLADADAAIEWAVDREWEVCVKESGGAFLYRPQAPRAVRLRVLERIVAALGPAAPRGAGFARWLAALEAGDIGTLGGVKGSRAPDGAWRFTLAPPHRGS